MKRHLSAGSIWELDDDLGRYRRMPRQEQPRERPEYGGPGAGPLEDFIWHPMTGWRMDPRGALIISTPGGHSLYAPPEREHPDVSLDRLWELYEQMRRPPPPEVVSG